MAAADRRIAILEAARLAFAEGNYHEVSLDTVAERAGVSKALLYEHFASKRELYQAMLELHTQDLVGRIGTAVTAAEPGEPRLLAGLNAFLDFVQDRRGGWRVIFRNAGDPDVAASIGQLRDGVAAAVAALMSEEAEEAFPDAPEREQMLQMVAQQLVGAMQSLADWWELHPEVPREEVLQAAMDFVWVGQDRLSRGERWSHA
jgi:AcrR family transcriptional regulator